MPNNLEAQFHEEMLNIYRRAKSECKYNASRFLQMVGESGGLAAARTLIRTKSGSEGYFALRTMERLDLTVEYLVLQAPWCSLFEESDLKIARKRLEGFLPS